MSYKPAMNSLPHKVIEFLTTNPDEELTIEDVSAKFDSPALRVHSILAQAIESGALQRIENADGDLAYRLGKGVPSIVAKPGTASSHKARHPLPSFAPPPHPRHCSQHRYRGGEDRGRCPSPGWSYRNGLARTVQADETGPVLCIAPVYTLTTGESMHRVQEVRRGRDVSSDSQRHGAAAVEGQVNDHA